MATIRFLRPLVSGPTTLQQIDYSPTRIMTTSTGGVVETYTGAFTFNSTTVSGGVVTGYSLAYSGDVAVTIEGLNAPAASLANAVLTGDLTTVGSILFGGNDEIWGSTFGEPIGGLAGNDTIIALDGADTVAGGAGNDDVNGNVGNDIVVGEDGDDWVRGGKDNDTIYGGAGNDPHVNGNLGDDVVFGDAGADTVFGGQGSDSLDGGTGNDVLSGDLGDDWLVGGTGADRFVLRAGAGVDLVLDFNAGEGDRIEMAAGVTYTYGLINGSVVYELSDGSRLVLVGVSDLSQATSWVVGV